MPLVAALLGAAAGVTTALVVPDDATPEEPTAFEDPLGVGIPLVNLDCTGQVVYVLGYGSTPGKIHSTINTHPEEDVRYLRTDASCDTLWTVPSVEEVPEYVAYSGPYDDPSEPCERRMRAKRDDVTLLVEGTDQYVRCFCYLPVSDLPELEPSDETTPQRAIWVRALQKAFVDMDADSTHEDRFLTGDISGIFDERTTRRVKQYQEQSVDLYPGTGVVETETWRALTDTVCE